MLSSSRRFQIEFGLFLLFIISIPSFEAPKNILYGLFFVAWIANRFIDKDWGGSWRLFDSLIALWMLCNIVVNLVSLYHGTHFSGAWDLLRYSSILWMVSRTRYTPQHYKILAVFFGISTAIALVWAYYCYVIIHKLPAFDLKSVGEHNHSAIYIVLSMTIGISFLVAFWSKINGLWRILGMLFFAATIYGLLLGASRAACGAAFLLMVIFVIAWFRKYRALSVALIVLMIAGIIVSCFHIPRVIQREVHWGSFYAHSTSPREGIRHTAEIAWKQKPIFGWGSHNYKLISPALVKQWAKADHYPANTYFAFAPHAHNLYLNTLAEMGIVGFIPLMLILIAWLYYCVRFYPRQDSSDLHWALWSICFGAWFINVSIGLLNTTLHHEHALESMTMLGMALSYFCRKRYFDQAHNLN